jgi:mannose-6-phosphate isomerase-like protein (cupin superfamily)
MAAIILDPGEVFEHCHATESSTQLRRGKVLFRYGDNVLRLRAGQSLAIPGGVPHTLENVGSGKAYVECYHGPTTGPDVEPKPPR